MSYNDPWQATVVHARDDDQCAMCGHGLELWGHTHARPYGNKPVMRGVLEVYRPDGTRLVFCNAEHRDSYRTMVEADATAIHEEG